MYRVCIAIVDAAHARLFELQRTSDPAGIHEQLIERADLVNPARRLPARELFSDPHPGVNHVGARGYTIDDHREGHLSHLDAQFAQSIVSELAPLAADAARLVICASPGMLGQLREVLGAIHRPGLDVNEIARDLVQLSPGEIRDQLVAYGFLPPAPLRSP